MRGGYHRVITSTTPASARPPADAEHDRGDGPRRDRLPRGDRTRAGGSARLLDLQPSSRKRSRSSAPIFCGASCFASAAPQGAAGMHGWAPRSSERSCAGNEPGGIPRRVSSRPRTQPRRRPGKPPDASRADRQPRRADDLADPGGPVRRSLRLGDPKSRPTAASRRDPELPVFIATATATR